MHIFHTRIKELRIESGLTQVQLAKELNYEGTIVRNWENGKRRTGFEGLLALSRFFDVSIDYLLGAEDQFGNKV